MLLALVAALALLVASVAFAASNEVRSCGKARNGWELYAGTGISESAPKTTCGFARTTLRKLRRLQEVTDLTSYFALKVKGLRLECHVVGEPFAQARCENSRRFVILLHY